jgi:hypothetical protein
MNPFWHEVLIYLGTLAVICGCLAIVGCTLDPYHRFRLELWCRKKLASLIPVDEDDLGEYPDQDRVEYKGGEVPSEPQEHKKKGS